MSESPEKFVRVWTKIDPENIKKKLLLIEEFHGVCGACRQLGLNYISDSVCPACGTQFEFVATKLKNPGEAAKIARRIEEKNLKLKLIDRDDFDKALAKDAIKDLFKKT